MNRRKRVRSKLTILLVIFLVLISVDVLGYILLEKVSFVDAIYMTFISITTVGYQEVFPLSPASKIFTILVIVTGIGIVFSIADTIVENTVEGRIRKILGRRKMEKNIYQMKGHVVVAGFGRMGATVCDNLAEQKMDFVVIETLADSFARAEERGYPVVQGDGTDEKILRVAGIEKAKTYIGLLSSDSDNILSVLTARELNPGLKIISRAFDPVNEKRLYKVGADMVVSPYQLGSLRIVSTVIKPNVVDFFDILSPSKGVPLSIEEFTVTEKSRLNGKKIRETRLREDFNAIVVAVKRNDSMAFNPAPDFAFDIGDIVIVLGEKDRLIDLA